MGLRFDGLYCCITRDDGGGLQNRVFRFYEDGTVLESTIGEGRYTQGVFPLPFWFRKDEEDFAGSRGTYTLTGEAIRFTCTSTNGSVDFSGRIAGDVLFLDSRSRINGHTTEGVGYAFQPFSSIDGWR